MRRAELLRLACCLATERGLQVIAPVHDALAVEAEAGSLEEMVAETQECMARASEAVLGGFRLRCDVEIIRHPDRFQDERGVEFWNRIMAINLTGYFLCIQSAAKMMKEQRGGAIINISAGSGERASPGGAVYSVSKGAINSLTRQAAVDLAPCNIRVNGLISGLVGTPIGQKDMGNRKPEYDIIPLRRIGQPEDVAEAAVFLASDKASYITNAILPVDGGRLNAMSSGSRG